MITINRNMCSTPYLSSETICSGRRLEQFSIGDELVLIQRVLKGKEAHFMAITGIVSGPSKYRYSNSYSYIKDNKDNELAGLYIPFISNGQIIKNNDPDYITKDITIDTIQPFNPFHNNTVIFKTVGVLRPELFISLTVSFTTNNFVTHTLLVTRDGFLVVII